MILEMAHETEDTREGASEVRGIAKSLWKEESLKVTELPSFDETLAEIPSHSRAPLNFYMSRAIAKP